MRFVILTTVSLFLSLCLVTNASGQTRETKPTGSISGRVMLGEQPASGVTIALTQRRVTIPVYTPFVQTVTDSEGRFHLTNVAAGVYAVAPLAPGFLVPSENNFFDEGKSVTVDDGEAVENINFVIKRGGVITGRITNENHEPLIETRVNLLLINERGTAQLYTVRNPFMNSTDDRGIYRFYGLPAGHYKVSVGELPNDGASLRRGGGLRYQRTFYPDVMDETKAEIIELSDGGEAVNIDISVNSKITTYAATGRIIDATTGKPISNVAYGFGTVLGSGQSKESFMGAVGFTNDRTNSKGEFRVDGMIPGRYAVFIMNGQEAELYAEPVVFEVKDANISGLEMKAQPGISISGVAVLEGATNPALLPALSQVRLFARISPRTLDAGFGNSSKISADGTFRISGLRAGKAQIYTDGLAGDKKFTLLRIEQNGVEVKDGIDIKEREQISDVRLVFTYGTAKIRGQVKVENGALSEGLHFMVMIRRTGVAETILQGMPVEVDERGRFIIEDLVAGEYELMLQPTYTRRPASGVPMLKPLKQTVTVREGADMQISFIVDLGEKKER